MKTNAKISLVAALLVGGAAGVFAKTTAPRISGDYLEVRDCDVWTGPCFANGEMGLTGKEGMMVWTVRQGTWAGVPLKGLSVIAVVHANGTLGNLHYQPRAGEAVLIVDQRANSRQKKALTEFARAMAGPLIQKVVSVKTEPMKVGLGQTEKPGCATVRAGNLVVIATRCLTNKDIICGNERVFYPPLTKDVQASPAFEKVASYNGGGLGVTWESIGERSAFLGTFAR